jgi:hypothetical protein
MKNTHILGIIIWAISALLPVFGQGEKVSERTALASGNLAPATDILPIVDVSAGSIGSKKITINDLFTGWGFTSTGEDMAKAANVAAQRTLLGLGTAALLDHGTGVGNLVRLNVSTGNLPAVNGSQLTDLTLANITLGTGATGDIYYRNSGGVLTKLAVGTDGHVLTLSSGLPAWSANAPSLANITLGTGATGDIYYRNSGGVLTKLAAGADGNVLTLASGLPSWAAGGGGLTNWTDALGSSAPNATVPVASLTATNAATNVDAAIIPKGSGALLGDLPDSAAAGGNKRGTNAVDWQTTRAAATEVASGATSVIGGGYRNTASGTSSTVGGGDWSIASGTTTTIGGGYSNTASDTNATVAGGRSNTASGNSSTVGGGFSNTASAEYATIVGGTGNTASGDTATVVGGENNTASGVYASVSGYYATTRGLYGMQARAAGRFAALGDAQTGLYLLRDSVTSDTPTEIALGDQTLGSTTRIVLPNDSSYGFKVHAVAKMTDEVTKVWRQEGAIKRGASAATTAIVGTTTEAVTEDAGASAWDLNLTADTTNGSLKVEVVGNSTGTTRFFVRIETVELTH